MILVGEMRDVETARIGDAVGAHRPLRAVVAARDRRRRALHRFLDMGIEPFLVASSVIGVVGQRLVRRICSTAGCRTSRPSRSSRSTRSPAASAKSDFSHGEGCNFCSNTGYEDRIGVYELLLVTQEMKQLLMGRANHDEILDSRERRACARSGTAASSSSARRHDHLRSPAEHLHDLRPCHDQVQIRRDDNLRETSARRDGGRPRCARPWRCWSMRVSTFARSRRSVRPAVRAHSEEAEAGGADALLAAARGVRPRRYPARRSLQIIEEESEDKTLRKVLAGVQESLVAGDTSRPRSTPFETLFPQFYIDMLRAAELTGGSTTCWTSYRDYIKRDLEARSKVKSALTYPAIILLCRSPR